MIKPVQAVQTHGGVVRVGDFEENKRTIQTPIENNRMQRSHQFHHYLSHQQSRARLHPVQGH